MASKYASKSIPIPKLEGKISYVKQGKSTYVAVEFSRVYRPSVRKIVPRRMVIGRVDANDPSRMFPNNRYEFFFPEKTSYSMYNPYHSGDIRYGLYLVVRIIADQYHLPEMLKKYFPPDAGILLDLATDYLYGNHVATRFYRYGQEHPLFTEDMTIYTREQAIDYLSAITDKDVKAFLSEWGGEAARKRCAYMTYNVLNKKIPPLPEKNGDEDEDGDGWWSGYDDEDELETNMAVGYDKLTRLPLFYLDTFGFTRDSVDMSVLASNAKELGYKKVGLILEEEHFTEEILADLDEDQNQFMARLPGNHPLMAPIVEQYRSSVENNPDCLIPSFRRYGVTVYATVVKAKVFPSQKARWVYLVYLPAKKAARENTLLMERKQCLDFFAKHAGENPAFSGSITEFFDFRYGEDHRLTDIVEKKDVLRREIDLNGYECLVCTEKMTPERALLLYREVVASSPTFARERPFLFHDRDDDLPYSAEAGRYLVAFLGLILRNKIDTMLKASLQDRDERPKHLFLERAIMTLEHMSMQRFREPDGSTRYYITREPTKKEAEIMSIFGLNKNTLSYLIWDLEMKVDKSNEVHHDMDFSALELADEDEDEAEDESPSYYLQWD